MRAVLAGALLLGVSGCNLGRDGQAMGQYAPDQFDQPSVRPQGANRLSLLADSGRVEVPVRGARSAPAGTIALDEAPDPFPKGSGDSVAMLRSRAGLELANPLPATAEVLERGRWAYRTWCAACHGTWGIGDGPVVDPFPRPISLQSRRVREYPDGAVFQVVWRGGDAMPAFSGQIEARDVWAVIRYLKVLQAAWGPADDSIALPAVGAVP